MAQETTDAPFKISSLVGNAGTGSNGEKLVQALDSMYPSELQGAQLMKPNPALSDGLKLSDVAKIAGPAIEVRDATVRGGELIDAEAWVTYAGYDKSGDTVKGAFPYPDLGKSSSAQHVSQSDRLQESDAARDHALAEAKRQSAAQAPAADADPIASYEEMSAQQIVAYLDDHPERAEVIKALESTIKGDKARKSVLEWEPPETEGGDGTGGGGQPPAA